MKTKDHIKYLSTEKGVFSCKKNTLLECHSNNFQIDNNNSTMSTTELEREHWKYTASTIPRKSSVFLDLTKYLVDFPE